MQDFADSIHSILAKHAQENSEVSAVYGVNGECLDYSSLWTRLTAAAHGIKARGVSSEDCVAMVFPEGLGAALSFLAISAVAMVAPLNPAYKEKDFSFYLEDLQPKAVVLPVGYDSEVIAVAERLGIDVLRVAVPSEENPDEFQLEGQTGESAANIELPSSDAVAMILHTSGTTSRPKMVPLSHANLAASAQNVATTLQLTSVDRGLNVMPLFHIHGIVGGLLSSLYAGASVTCAPGFQGEHFLNWAKNANASWYSAVPTIHQAVLELAKESPELASQLDFRLIRSSSAALPPTVFKEMEDQWEAPVIESYGMTEAAHQMASNQLPPEKRKPGSVGIAAGPEVTVLDDSGNVLGQDAIGEVAIRGRNVTAGYVSNPEANASSFSDGWFRTGDQGYFDEDGYLFLTGRIKEMINRGGENIAPKEIDEILLEHDAVVQAVAFAVPHPSLGEDLAAAIIKAEGSQVTELELRDYLAERVAGFKVPSRIVFVDSIPKGPTGKLQRIGLYERLQAHFTEISEEPSSEEEVAVANAFASVLSLEKVNVEDNFFYLGGDSLKAQRVLNILREQFSIEIEPALLFRLPTPQLLAEKVAELRNAESVLDDLVGELEGLSAEELEALLAE